MIFQDNILKAYLKNVYFISGTPCGGKSTISKALAKKHGVAVYDLDRQMEEHKKISNPQFQPSINKIFKNADEFFGRSVEEYKDWLLSNRREQLDFMLLDLIRLSENQIVVCDCDLTVKEADKLTDSDRIVFLIKDPTHLVDDYCNRLDHQDFSNYINSCTDVEMAKATCNETLRQINAVRCEEIKNSPYLWIERNADSRVEKTLRIVEKHFGW